MGACRAKAKRAIKGLLTLDLWTLCSNFKCHHPINIEEISIVCKMDIVEVNLATSKWIRLTNSVGILHKPLMG